VRILHWFRKDLRLDDNLALSEAVADAAGDVVPFYASEPEMLARADMAPARVRFALESLADLRDAIEALGSRLVLDHGPAVDTVARAAAAAGATAVYWNEEYEPSLIERDRAVEQVLRARGFEVRRFDDRLLVPPGAVMTRSGTPFVVFGAFERACRALPQAAPRARVTRLAAHSLPSPPLATLERLGFVAPPLQDRSGGARHAERRLADFLSRLEAYAQERDRPAASATSRLSADLKFGTLSVRRVEAAVSDAAIADPRLAFSASKFVSELRWRDFFAHVLFHFPHCERGAFRPEYDALEWPGDVAHFEAWRAGLTGYPIVDAGMRELARSGTMHNRVRMIVASFLVKDLLLDWRLGERHFMQHLIDGDLASNNGGWQWAASTGTDAVPYFRVFNPLLQGMRFDPRGEYVRRWIPEVAHLEDRCVHRPWEMDQGVPGYPRPIVDHGIQRAKAVELYRRAGKAQPRVDLARN